MESQKPMLEEGLVEVGESDPDDAQFVLHDRRGRLSNFRSHVSPVSSMVSFELFARSGIRKMMGFSEPVVAPVRGVAGGDMLRGTDGKTHFARVHATQADDGRYHASFSSGQGSQQLSAIAAANALAIVPSGDGITTGEPVDLLLL